MCPIELSPRAIRGTFVTVQKLPEAGNGPLHMVEVDFKYIDYADYGERVIDSQ